MAHIAKSDVRNIIAVQFTCGIFGFLGLLMFRPIPQENKELIREIATVAIVGGVVTILGWLFTRQKETEDGMQPNFKKETITMVEPPKEPLIEEEGTEEAEIKT